MLCHTTASTMPVLCYYEDLIHFLWMTTAAYREILQPAHYIHYFPSPALCSCQLCGTSPTLSWSRSAMSMNSPLTCLNASLNMPLPPFSHFPPPPTPVHPKEAHLLLFLVPQATSRLPTSSILGGATSLPPTQECDNIRLKLVYNAGVYFL